MTRVWLVTGGSRGLGRAIVIGALEAGDRVVATARKPEQLRDLVDTYGERITATKLDVTDPNSCREAVSVAVKTFGRVDVVVNNAGYANVAAVEDVTLDDFAAQVETNFYGVVYVTKAVLPILREQGAGHIVQISSAGDRIPLAGLSAYQSAKWAVAGFSSVLAQEVAPLGIKVTVVEPGGMTTDWAGSSMTIPQISEPYEQTVGERARAMRSNSGAETSDPVKVAEAIIVLANAEEPPVRILLGSDAVQYAAAVEKALADSDAAWRELSISTSRQHG
jgi:NAD(P)-dependent dehydrogenase (short-subunit alcohol dehydrogenase family)